jgi:hypothetical protein
VCCLEAQASREPFQDDGVRFAGDGRGQTGGVGGGAAFVASVGEQQVLAGVRADQHLTVGAGEPGQPGEVGGPGDVQAVEVGIGKGRA